MSFRLPKPSMAVYAAENLRAMIAGGEWSDFLPGGRTLSARLNVSRPTLYRALEMLQREGLVAGKPKSAWKILNRLAPVAADRVVLVSPFLPEEFNPLMAYQQARLARALAERGLALELARVPGIDREASERALDKLGRQWNPRCWLLYRCCPQAQRWFERAGRGLAVIGTTPPGLRAHSVDVDFAAVMRHAHGALRRLGHATADIAYLTPEEPLVGSLAARTCLADIAEKEGTTARVADLPRQPAKAGETICRMLASRRPSALVIHRGSHALAAIGQMWRLGVRCPEDISLLVLEDNLMLEAFSPEIARYRINPERMQTAILRAIDAALGRIGKHRMTRALFPELIPGSTLGPPRRIGGGTDRQKR